MNEVVLIPTYKRPELLFYCLSLVRAFEPDIEIHIFPDRGTFHDQMILEIAEQFRAIPHLVPDSRYYGPTPNAMNAFLWSFNAGYEKTFYLEDDVMIHPDFFAFHREVHEECPDIFCSSGWIFNREAPITTDWLSQPWFYAIGVCFSRLKLGLIAKHAGPLYYENMAEYVGNTFKKSPVNDPDNIAHWEFDGLIQRVLDEDRTQMVTSGIARCSHIGFGGFNAGYDKYEAFFEGCKSFEERVAKISEFIGDPYARAEVFGRAIVEREIGRALPKREFKYHVKVGEFESEIISELSLKNLGRRLNSVNRTPDMEIVVLS